MKNILSLLLITIITISTCVIKVNDVNFGKEGNYGVVDWDNFGYYLYLPATFIYDDIKLQNPEWAQEAQKKYHLSSNFYQAHYISNGNRIIQYTSGMAFLYSPAFFAGHIVAKFSSAPADGFSKPYQIALLIQSFLMVFIGLFYLRKFSLQFFNDKLTTTIILLIALGTNFFQISFSNISSPHVYLFAIYAIILYCTVKWHEKQKLKYALVIGLSSALMILSRPNELLFLIIPVFWLGGTITSYKQKLSYFLAHKKHLFAIAIPLVLFGIIQPLYWHYVTGEWLYDSYKNEDFKLLNPYLSEYLFSYKKGWLLYTPIMIFGLLAFIPFYKKKKVIALPMSVFIIINIWVLSSWDCWWYADSFSQRSIVQSYPIFVLPFGYLLMLIYDKYRFILISFSLLLITLISFNLFQTYQFSKGIIDSKLMTKEYFWSVFGLTDEEKTDRSLLEIDRNINYLPGVKPKKHSIIYSEDFSEFSNQSTFIVDNREFSEEGSLMLTKEKPVTEKLKFSYKDIADSSYCYAIARIRFKSNYEAAENPFGIEFNMIDSYNGKGYGYKYRGVENISWFQKGSWSSMDIVVIPPFLRNQDDSIQFNLKLKGNKLVEIDQFSIEILDPSKAPPLETLTFQQDYHTLIKGTWNKPSSLFGKKGYNLIDSLSQYSSTFSIQTNELEARRKIKLTVNSSSENVKSETYAIVSINKEGKNLYYKSYPIKPKAEWKINYFEYELPESLPQDAELKAYLWNKSSSATLIRNIEVVVD